MGGARASTPEALRAAALPTSYASITRAALERFAPRAVLVDGRTQILHTHGPVDDVLSPPGRARNSLVQRLPKGLRGKFHAALKSARLRRTSVVVGGTTDAGQPSMEVVPIHGPSSEPDNDYYLIAFRDGALPRRANQNLMTRGQLQVDLQSTQDELRCTLAQLKRSNEDLRASHEETTSVNEELQSMNEELESSKEELQSVNEELNTVNTQLQTKVTELEVSNADLRNLLASNEVATLCIDRAHGIKWFTPAAHQLFNLLPTDIGRPLTDLAIVTIDSTLIDDSNAVFRNHRPQAHEVRHKGVYLRRIVPYWTDNRQVAGAVISFVDITEAKRASEAQILEKARANEQLEARVGERTEELGRLARELAFAEVRERQSIARDLHDGLGQELNAASIKLDALRSNPPSAASAHALDEIAELLEGVVREMRSLTAQLNPPVLEQLGLAPALEWLGEEMRRSYELEVALKDDEVPKPLDSVTGSIVFRAVRELLINVARHAKVDIARVAVCREGNEVVVVVEDKGAGFNADGQSRDSTILGLVTLRERIAHIGGSFQIKSEPLFGTTATIRAPLKVPA